MDLDPKFRIVGVGGCGCNCLNWIQEREQTDSGYIVIDTDEKALAQSPVRRKIRIDFSTPAGSPDKKMAAIGIAASEMKDRIKSALAGCDFVFILAGMGGATGSSAARAVADAASASGATSVAIVTMPFTFEGKQARAFAGLGLDTLEKSADVVFCVENNALLKYLGPDKNMNMVAEAGHVFFYETILTLMDAARTRGELNVSLMDLKNFLSGNRPGVIGMGENTGKDFAASRAMTGALSGHFLHGNIERASTVLVVIRGSDMPLYEINSAMQLVSDEVGPDTVIYNHVIDDSSYIDTVRIVVFAVF